MWAYLPSITLPSPTLTPHVVTGLEGYAPMLILQDALYTPHRLFPRCFTRVHQGPRTRATHPWTSFAFHPPEGLGFKALAVLCDAVAHAPITRWAAAATMTSARRSSNHPRPRITCPRFPHWLAASITRTCTRPPSLTIAALLHLLRTGIGATERSSTYAAPLSPQASAPTLRR